MKKRAIFSTVASLALAGVMCVGFAACGGSNAKDIAGEQVDEATWNAALDFKSDAFKNFKIEIEDETNMEMTMADKSITTESTVTQTISYVDQKTYGKYESTGSMSGDIPDEYKEAYEKEIEENTFNFEYYVDETGDARKVIAQVDGNWKYVANESEYKYYYFCESALDTAKGLPSKEFSDYEYSEENKGYVLKDHDEGEITVIKIKDGKLKAVYYEASGSEQGQTFSMTMSYVFTYGDQTVELPTVA